ncbi:MAG: hypothetical protein ABIV25_11505 [Paracoccaceae bacterium]
MMPLLYKIPETLLMAVNSGKAQLTGAIIKDSVTGFILGHVQPTNVFEKVFTSALQGVSATLSSGFSPLGIISAVQNEQIKSRLNVLQSSMGLLQDLQVGTLAVSGLGLGVSAVGFAVMQKRLNGIESSITALAAQIDRVTNDRRGDEITVILANIQAELDTVDTLSSRNDPTRVAEDAQRGLAKYATSLETHFSRVADTEGRMTLPDLELLWSLAAAIRLCSDAGIKSLYYINELATAAEIAKKQASSFEQISANLSPDRLARLTASSAKTADEMFAIRRASLPLATTLVNGLRSSAIGIWSQSALSAALLKRGASGRAYLAEIEAEKDLPLLLLLPA